MFLKLILAKRVLISAKVTYESRMSNLTSRCSQMESTAATVIVSEVVLVVLLVVVMGRTSRWLPYMHWGFNGNLGSMTGG